MTAHVSSPVLIGRSNELERLRADLDEASAGRGTATLVAGEAGVGKTRLAGELVAIAQAEGAAVLQGGCIDVGEGALPYAPIAEALRGLVHLLPAEQLDAILGPARGELSRLVPDLGPPAGIPDVAQVRLESAQGRLFELLLGVLERLSAAGPVLLVVEDLHWSDRSTRELLAFLVRNLRDSGVMLVMTYRSDELHRRHPLLPFLAELERSGRAERIELRRFDRRELADQLHAITGQDVDPALVQSIHARSDGNPFFTEELLVSAGEDGAGELPATLRDVLLAHIAELSEPTQEFLRIASAAGPRVDPALLAAAADLDETAVYAALRECVGRQVLLPDPVAGAERYAFRHALVQEAVYDDLLPGERTRLHGAFARSLEARYEGSSRAEHAGEIAYHWYAAHELERALESSVQAAEAAEARYAFAEATLDYERALELWDRVPSAEPRVGRDRVDLLAALASVARFFEPTRAIAHIQGAIRLVDADTHAIRAGLLNERLGRIAWNAGQGVLSEQAYRTAVGLIPAQPPSEARARALAGLAQMLFLRSRFDESLPLAEEGLALARAAGARAVEGHALNTRGSDRVIFGEVDPAVDDLRTALAIAEEVGSVDDIGRAYANWMWVLDVAGRSKDAVAVADAGIEAMERLGVAGFFGTHLLYWKADWLFRLGRWTEAAEAAHRADDIGPLGINRILIPEILGRLAAVTGDFEEAEARLRLLAKPAERAADLQFLGPVQASLAELALWQGRPDVAAGEADKAIRILAPTLDVRVGELYALAVRAHADMAEVGRARRSRDDEARATAAGNELVEALRRREEAIPPQRRAFEARSAAWLPLVEAEATRLQGRPDPDAWRRAADLWQRLDRRYLVAYIRWREAEARLARRGDRDAAATELREALDVAVAAGAAPLAAEIRGLAMRARLPIETGAGASVAALVSAADDADRLGLTSREREVLGLLALGRTNRQIAEELFISENTAGVHVSNILGKLGVSGRGEAAAIAHRLGITGGAEGRA
jgi:DNA-binding CsgD family transcriptional regulator/tetratricopeptide (TPR) repeat protein